MMVSIVSVPQAVFRLFVAGYALYHVVFVHVDLKGEKGNRGLPGRPGLVSSSLFPTCTPVFLYSDATISSSFSRVMV